MITLVTGLWDIGRGELTESWSRSFDYYLDNFLQLLKVENNMIIFGDQKLKEFVFKNRKEYNTQFILRDLSWFKNNEFYDPIQKIRTNPDWYNQASWLKESTQSKLEMYNPLVMSKMYLLNDSRILDKFNSEKLYWIDAGLANTVNMGYFTNDDILKKVNQLENFTFICFPYQANNEIHGFEYLKINEYSNDIVDKVARGGFFGGPKHMIDSLNTIYYNLMKETLSKGLMGTEESLFTILVYNHPYMINYFEINSDGLLYKFFENLKNNKLEIKNKTKKRIIKKTTRGTVGLYVISFNSPKQFESLINTMYDYDSDFLEKTEKFLLNNSTDLSTTKEYQELCEKYNFNHIKKNNIGITGGRVFISDHFDKTDLEFYMFFEDDMLFYNRKEGTCKNGFNRYITNLYDKILEIMKKENFDFLKFNYTEFFGSHEKQWSWYNVPQGFREKHWPNNSRLPTHGQDSNSPNLEFKNIKSLNGLPYANGEIYLSNWPIIMSKKGNFKCYLETKFDHPYEQTLMSHCYQQTIKGQINSSVLLITPTEHNRFDFYKSEERKEC